MANANSASQVDFQAGLGEGHAVGALTELTDGIQERMLFISTGTKLSDKVQTTLTDFKTDGMTSLTSKITAAEVNSSMLVTDLATEYNVNGLGLGPDNNLTDKQISQCAAFAVEVLVKGGMDRKDATSIIEKARIHGQLKTFLSKSATTGTTGTTTKTFNSAQDVQDLLVDLVVDKEFLSSLSLGELTSMSTLMQYDQSLYDMVAAAIKALLANVKKNANQLGGG
jgi:hypothetical protein